MVGKLFPLGRCLYPSPKFLQLIVAIMELIKLIMLNLLIFSMRGLWEEISFKMTIPQHEILFYMPFHDRISCLHSYHHDLRKHCLYNRTWGAVPFNCHDTITLCWIFSNRSYTEEFDFHIIAIYMCVCGGIKTCHGGRCVDGFKQKRRNFTVN